MRVAADACEGVAHSIGDIAERHRAGADLVSEPRGEVPVGVGGQPRSVEVQKAGDVQLVDQSPGEAGELRVPGRVRKPRFEELEVTACGVGVAQLFEDELADRVAEMGGVEPAGELRGVLTRIGEGDQPLRRSFGVDAVEQLLGEDLADAVGGRAHAPQRAAHPSWAGDGQRLLACSAPGTLSCAVPALPGVVAVRAAGRDRRDRPACSAAAGRRPRTDIRSDSRRWERALDRARALAPSA